MVNHGEQWERRLFHARYLGLRPTSELMPNKRVFWGFCSLHGKLFRQKQSHRKLSVSTKRSGTDLRHAALLSALMPENVIFAFLGQALVYWLPVCLYKKHIYAKPGVIYSPQVPEDGDLMNAGFGSSDLITIIPSYSFRSADIKSVYDFWQCFWGFFHCWMLDQSSGQFWCYNLE